MFGSIIGDITANRYANDSLHINQDRYTIYSIYTIAIADALIQISKQASKEEISFAIETSIIRWKEKEQINQEIEVVYPSLVSVAYLYDSLERTLQVATYIMDLLDPFHTKEAAAFVTIVYLARMKYSKEQIARYMTLYHQDDNSLVYRAFLAFDQAKNFSDTIYLALEKGIDSSIMANMCGAMAQAYYGYPAILVAKALMVLSSSCQQFCFQYTKFMRHENPFLMINEQIEHAIKQYQLYQSYEEIEQICNAFDVCIDLYSHLVIPISVHTTYNEQNEEKHQFSIHKIYNEKGTWFLGYLNHHEAEIGDTTPVMVANTLEFLQYAYLKNVDGILLDQYSYAFYLDKKMIKYILDERNKNIY